MNNIFSLDDNRSTYDKVSKAISSDSFILIYMTEDGALGVLQGDQSSVMDMGMFNSLSNFITNASIESMYMNQGEE